MEVEFSEDQVTPSDKQITQEVFKKWDRDHHHRRGDDQRGVVAILCWALISLGIIALLVVCSGKHHVVDIIPLVILLIFLCFPWGGKV
jgi:hypothetical protein